MALLKEIAERFAAVCGLPQRRQEPSALALARRARADALVAYAAAKRRRDSRAVHAAHKELRQATTEAVRAELGR